MHYLIDGYNLLHHVGLLSGRSESTAFEQARQTLLRQLSAQLVPHAQKVTVAFDAQGSPGSHSSWKEYRGVEVHFTRWEEADDLIERLIFSTPNPRLLTVVTNDRRIKEAARRRGCQVQDCVSFWEFLFSPQRIPVSSMRENSEPSPRNPQGEIEHWLATFGDVDEDPEFMDLMD